MATIKVAGVVEHGKKIARNSGYPTANLALNNNERDRISLIEEGVYCGWTRIEGGEPLPSLVFYGIPYALPDVSEPRLEVHLLDDTVDLYGKELTVELAVFVRANQKFDNAEDSQKAIEGDVRKAREYFSL